jgi:hypothetical protein
VPGGVGALQAEQREICIVGRLLDPFFIHYTSEAMGGQA